MTSLQETLSALSNSLGGLSARVHGVVEEGQELEQAAAALLDECRGKQDQAGELFERVQEALAEHREQTEQQQEALQSGLAHVETEVGALNALAQAEQQVSDEAGEVAGALSELQSRLASESAELGGAHSRLRAALDQVEETARERQAAIEKTMLSLTNAAESVQDTAEDTRAALTDQLQAMAEAARLGKAVLEQVVGQMTGDVLPGLASQLEGTLQETQGTLEEALQEIAAEWRERLEDEIKGRARGGGQGSETGVRPPRRGGAAAHAGRSETQAAWRTWPRTSRSSWGNSRAAWRP